jgi:hypothetical protein
MFVHERGDELHLGRALPRAWLSNGLTVGIEDAPTYFGPLTLEIRSHVDSASVLVTLKPPTRNPPRRILLRIRHPQAKPIRSVTVNGAAHADFDVEREWVVLPGRLPGPQQIVIRYD